jgi:type II secretory ATPase GspE/PulE/Tfp pilus assembly ATPase PilB-like protein
MIAWLNNEQHHAFESIINTVLSNNAGFFFVSGYGGTGKTFLWNTIITYLCGHKKIVLSIASSESGYSTSPGRPYGTFPF